MCSLLTPPPPPPQYNQIISVLGSPAPDVWERCFSSLPESHGGKVPEFDLIAEYVTAVRVLRCCSNLISLPLSRSLCSARPLDVMLSRVSPGAVALIQKMLAWDPAQRITAFEALSDPYFQQEPHAEQFIITSSRSS
jgi:serine/threonine protein kinase